MVIEISNGIENTQFVQLKNGVSRKTYGNLLEDFVVLDHCKGEVNHLHGTDFKFPSKK